MSKKQKCRCALSGRQLTPENVSIDHITPIGKGGSNNKENLQLTTKEVNNAKNVMTIQELVEMCRDVTVHLAGSTHCDKIPT